MIAAASHTAREHIPLWAGIAVWCVEMPLVAILSGRRLGGRVAVLVTGLMLAIPFMVTAPPLSRLLLMCSLALPFAGAVELMFAAPVGGFRARLGFMGTWNTHQATRRARRFDAVALVQLVAATAVLAGAIAAVKAVPESGLWLAVRWVAGGIGVLAFGEMATAFPNLLTAALGVSVPPFMRSPYRSASVTEFWTRRWNIATSELFHKYFFSPLARHGPGLALFATFAFSALAHTFLADLALGRWRIAVVCGAFFLVQPLLIAAERRLHVRRWAPAAGRAWTLTVLAIASPLFVEPVLQFVEGVWGGPSSVLLPTVAVLGFVIVACGIIFSLASLAPRLSDTAVKRSAPSAEEGA